MSDESRSFHRVEWTLESGDFVRGDIICEAPETAECRTYCPRDECAEQGCMDRCHKPAPRMIPAHLSTIKQLAAIKAQD